MKKFTSASLSAVLALTLAACSSNNAGGSTAGSGTEQTGTGNQTLTLGLSGIKGTFNPFIADTVYDNYVVNLVFEALIDNDASGEYTPWLIEDMPELSEDKLTYTFTLKDGITFSDGTPLTAEDVAFSYNVTKEADYAGPRTAVGAAISEINVIDEKTIAFTMTEASPANLKNFTYGILSKDYYAHSSFEELTSKNTAPMGSGPFVMNGYANKQYVDLKKNENYWDAANHVQIEGVLFQEVAEETLLPALQNGEIDFCMPAAKRENVEGIEALEGIAHLHSYLGNGYTFLCWNCGHEELAQKEVRQALMYGMDRPSFLMAEYGSDQLVSLGMAPISPCSWAYPEEGLNEYAYNPDKANELLDAAGWTGRTTEQADDGTTVEVRTNANGTTLDLDWYVYTDSTWPQTLSAMCFSTWKELGVNLHIKQYDFATVSDLVQAGDPAEREFDIYTMGFSLGIDPDPTDGLFDADAIRDGGFNASQFRDERAQELIQLGKEEFDQAKRAEIYKEWATIQNEECPTNIIAYRSEIWGISNRVDGLDEISSYCNFTDKDIIKNVVLH